jgi:hypothetical protein
MRQAAKGTQPAWDALRQMRLQGHHARTGPYRFGKQAKWINLVEVLKNQ